MGTNFYWADSDRSDDPDAHIGKRSAAGLYCWDCGITLCKGGEDEIHWSRSEWYDACPKCGKAPQRDSLDSSPAAVELGFAKPKTQRPTGVRGCSSFRWCQGPGPVGKRIAAGALVVDEYGREIPGDEFLAMVEANCPVQFMSLGDWWS